MSSDEQKSAYNSHKWNSVRDPYTMEWYTSCLVCGIEDLGDPDEFDIDYPMCDDDTLIDLYNRKRH